MSCPMRLHTPHSDRWSGNLSWPSSALARVQAEATSTVNTLIGHFQTQTKKETFTDEVKMFPQVLFIHNTNICPVCWSFLLHPHQIVNRKS